MAARKTKGTKEIPWPEKMRQHIQAGNIHRRLMDGFNGKVELTPQQVTIGLGLLRKVSPDLAATEISGEINTKPKVVSSHPLSADEWGAKYADTLEPTTPLPSKLNGNGQAH